jgi:hypothetical protein
VTICAFRLGLLAAAAATSLAFSPAAFGAYSPSLSITRNLNLATRDVGVDVTFAQTRADDPTARVQILSPFEFEPGLDQSPGTQLGTLDGSVSIRGIATAPVTGTVKAEDAANGEVMAAAKECTGTASHTAVWRLSVGAAGQTVPDALLVYVDTIVAPPFSEFASTSMQLCLPHPSVAPLGIKLLTATLHLRNVFSTFTPHEFLRFSSMWTAINTPYASDTRSDVDVPGTVQTQSLDRWLVGASFSATRHRRTRKVEHRTFTDLYYSYFTTLRGSVSAGVPAEAKVEIFAGEKKVAEVTTDAYTGSFTWRIDLAKTTTYHAVYTRPAFAVLPESRPPEGPWTCQPALPLGSATMMCGEIIFGGYQATTEEATVTKPKLTHKRVKHKKRKRKH